MTLQPQLQGTYLRPSRYHGRHCARSFDLGAREATRSRGPPARSPSAPSTESEGFCTKYEHSCTEHGALVHVVLEPLHVVGALYARSSERSCTELGALMHGARSAHARSPSATCTESECHLHGVRVPPARSPSATCTESECHLHGARSREPQSTETEYRAARSPSAPCTKSECHLHGVQAHDHGVRAHGQGV